MKKILVCGLIISSVIYSSCQKEELSNLQPSETNFDASGISSEQTLNYLKDFDTNTKGVNSSASKANSFISEKMNLDKAVWLLEAYANYKFDEQVTSINTTDEVKTIRIKAEQIHNVLILDKEAIFNGYKVIESELNKLKSDSKIKIIDVEAGHKKLDADGMITFKIIITKASGLSNARVIPADCLPFSNNPASYSWDYTAPAAMNGKLNGCIPQEECMNSGSFFYTNIQNKIVFKFPFHMEDQWSSTYDIPYYTMNTYLNSVKSYATNNFYSNTDVIIKYNIISYLMPGSIPFTCTMTWGTTITYAKKNCIISNQ